MDSLSGCGSVRGEFTEYCGSYRTNSDKFDGSYRPSSFIDVADNLSAAEVPRYVSESRVSDDGTDRLDAVYREHFDMVWRGLRRLGVPLSMVDDATQDVFLVVHRRLKDFRPKGKLRSWVYAITVHMARYYRRKASRAYSEDPETCLVDQFSLSPAAQVEHRQALEVVYAALQKLSDDHREVFVLADIEELSAPEIAELLKIPINTVYSRLRHARAHFETLVERTRTIGRSR